MRSKFSLFFVLLALTFADKVASRSGSCEYFKGMTFYVCEFTVDHPNEAITNIIGKHESGKTNNDVEMFRYAGDELTNISPIGCQKFPNLKKFSSRNGGVERITDDSFATCRNLEVLLLDENVIITVSRNAFDSQTHLKELDLKGNKIRELPDGVFNTLINLEILDLASNKLRTLSSTLFKNLRKLKSLDLERNNIIDLPISIFGSLINLEILHLSHNKLTTIRSTSFGHNGRIKQLYFGYNQLTSFDQSILDISSKLETFNANANTCASSDAFFFEDPQVKAKAREALKKCIKNYRV